MKPATDTFDGSINGDARAQRFRNAATGVGNTFAVSEARGAMRSQRVIDAAPVSQLKVKDRSYPAPGPVFDAAAGKLVDRLTGKAVKLTAC